MRTTLTLVLTGILLAGNAFADLQEDYKVARKESRDADAAYRAIRYGPDFDKAGEYKKVDVEYSKVVSDLVKTRNEHPEMKKLAADEKRLLGEMTKLSPGSEAFSKTQEAYRLYHELTSHGNYHHALRGLR